MPPSIDAPGEFQNVNVAAYFGAADCLDCSLMTGTNNGQRGITTPTICCGRQRYEGAGARRAAGMAAARLIVAEAVE